MTDQEYQTIEIACERLIRQFAALLAHQFGQVAVRFIQDAFDSAELVNPLRKEMTKSVQEDNSKTSTTSLLRFYPEY